MNKKQLVMTFIICLLLTAAGAILYIKEDKEVKKDFISADYIPSFDVNEVSGITIEGSNKKLYIEKKKGQWVLSSKYGYPASFELIVRFINDIRELKPVRELREPKIFWKNYHLNPPGQENSSTSGTMVTLEKEGAKKILSMILGKMHYPNERAVLPPGVQAFPNGRYILLVADTAKPVLTHELFEEAVPEPGAWFDRQFFFVPPRTVKKISSKTPGGNLLWQLDKADAKGKWHIIKNNFIKKLDVTPEKVGVFMRDLYTPMFTNVTPLKDKNMKLINTLGIITIETFQGNVYEIRIGANMENNDEFFLKLDIPVRKSEDSALKRNTFFTKWIYEVPKKVADSCTCPADIFTQR